MKIKQSILREALVERTRPVILFDYETIEENFKMFHRLSIDAGATWSLAVKAFARSEIMDIAKNFVDGFDISNTEEWNIVKHAVTSKHKIWLTNANLHDEIDFFLKEVRPGNLLVTINDLEDYQITLSKNVPYLVRISTSELIKQSSESRFGLTIKDLNKIQTALMSDKNFKGFHLHQGLEDHSYTIMEPLLHSIKNLFMNFANRGYLFNLGGGLQLFSESELKATLTALSGLFITHIEPGRALFKGSGLALAPIHKYFKEDGLLRIFTRLSFIGHLKWSKPNFSGILNLNETVETIETSKLVLEGPTCYEFDRSEEVTIDTPLSFTKGSLVVLSNISGYSVEWNTSFNGIPACEVKFVGRKRSDNP